MRIDGPSSTDSVRNGLLAVASLSPLCDASVVIGSRKNALEAERNVLLLSRPFCRANSKRRQNRNSVLLGIRITEPEIP